MILIINDVKLECLFFPKDLQIGEEICNYKPDFMVGNLTNKTRIPFPIGDFIVERIVHTVVENSTFGGGGYTNEKQFYLKRNENIETSING